MTEDNHNFKDDLTEKINVNREKLKEKCNYFIEKGQWDDVIEVSRKLRVIDDSTPFSWLSEGLAFYDKDDFKNALAVFDDGIKRFPNDGKLRLRRAYTEKMLGRIDDAKHDCTTVLQLDSQNTQAQQLLERLSNANEQSQTLKSNLTGGVWWNFWKAFWAPINGIRQAVILIGGYLNFQIAVGIPMILINMFLPPTFADLIYIVMIYVIPGLLLSPSLLVMMNGKPATRKSGFSSAISQMDANQGCSNIGFIIGWLLRPIIDTQCCIWGWPFMFVHYNKFLKNE